MKSEHPARAGNRGHAVGRVVALVVLSVILAVVVWLMDRASIRVQLDAYVLHYGFFVNAVPALLVFLVLLVVSNRALLSLMLTLMLAAAIYGANMMKLKYLDTPVAYSDLYLLGNLHAATLELLSNYVSVWAIVGGIVAVAALVWLSLWLEPPFFRRRSVPRAGIAIVALACMIGIGIGARWVGRVYSADRLRVVAWAPMLTILHSGLFSSIVYTSAERERALDVPVDQQAVDNLLKMDTGPALPEQPVGAEKPDIVVIQSESFFDPGILKDVDNTDATLPNLHRALAAGIGGTMKAPTFGGGTLRTEFEVLTGIPMAAYPTIEFPYLQITRKTIPSIVAVARNDGYTAVAIHGNDGNFWNRTKAFKAIGFDRFITADDFPENAARDGWFYADSAMTDEIIDHLKTAHKPALIFAISIEAHGPYDTIPVKNTAERDAIAVPPDLTGKGPRELQNYLYHIEHADQQLGRLWDYLASRNRPYILVFYGDHLPGLQHVYKTAGFDDGRTGPQEYVPWFIVGSDIHNQPRHIKAWMMGSEILRAAGIPQGPYYTLIAKAERGLQQKPGESRADAIEQGVYSLARLYLRGRLQSDLQQTAPHGGKSIASNQAH